MAPAQWLRGETERSRKTWRPPQSADAKGNVTKSKPGQMKGGCRFPYMDLGGPCKYQVLIVARTGFRPVTSQDAVSFEFERLRPQLGVWLLYAPVRTPCAKRLWEADVGLKANCQASQPVLAYRSPCLESCLD